MFYFMSLDYRGDQLWRYGELRRSRALERGTIFDADELAAILALWAEAIQPADLAHCLDRLRLPLRTGGHVELTPSTITVESDTLTPEALQASMKHIAAHWGGKASIPLDPSRSRADRLQIRAYAEVYGIELLDANAVYLNQAFTQAELAALPALRAEIRARHKDAPPARPDEDKQLAASYARRYPFRVPAAA